MKQVFWTLITLLSHWRRRPANFVALFVGLAIATALWSGVQALNEHARKSYNRAASNFGGGDAKLVPANGATIPQDLFVKLRRAGWKVSPTLEGTILVRGIPFQLIGIEPITLPQGFPLGVNAGDNDFFAFSSPPGQTVAAPETLHDLRAGEGAVLTLDGGNALPPIRLSIGIPPGLLVVDIGIAQVLLKRPGQLSRLILQPQPSWTDLGTPPLATVAGGALRLRPPGEEEADLRRLTESFHLNLTAFGLLSCVVGFFIVHAAYGLAFEQRLAMVRTMRAVGVSSRALVVAMLSELTLLALAAGSAGVAVGYGLASALLPNVAASLDALYGAQVTGRLTLNSKWLLSALGIALFGALVAAAGGLYKALRLPVLVAAQPYAWGRRSNASCGAGGFLRSLPLPRRWRPMFGAKASIRVSR